MKAIRSCFSFLFLLFSLNSLPAQSLHIVKDNIACTYGLKDEAGEWVIQPGYTLIQQTSSGHFLITSGLRNGLLDANGTQILPNQYDDISPFLGRWSLHDNVYNPLPADRGRNPISLFKIQMNGKLGLASTRGKVLFPPEYDHVAPDNAPHLVLYRQKEGSYFSTYADTSGNIILPERAGYLLPFFGNSVGLLGSDRLSDRMVKGPAGVIDREGKELVPPIYDKIQFCAEGLLVVEKDDHHGVIDNQGKVIIPLEYRILEVQQRSYMPCLGQAGGQYFRIIKGNKMGIMRENGKVLVPPKYDRILTPNQHPRPEEYEWGTLNEGKYGTLSLEGVEMIPPIYDSLVPLFAPRGQSPANRQTNVHLLVKKEGKYGLIDGYGKELETVRNHQFAFFNLNYKPGVLFLAGKSLKYWDLSQYPARQLPVEFVAELPHIRVYRVGDTWIPFYISRENPSKISLNPPGGYAPTFRNFAGLPVMYHNGLFYVLDKEGKQKSLPYQSIDESKGPLLEVQTLSRKKALLDPKTGNLVTDTLYAEFNQSFSNADRLWARPLLKNGQAPSAHCGNWVILNPKTEKALGSTVYDYPFPFRDTLIAISDKKAGLLDAQTLKWVIPPQNSYLEKVDWDHFLAINTRGKQGLIGKEGNPLAEVEWDQIEEVYTNFVIQATHIPKQSNHLKWWLLVQDKDSVLLSSRGEWIREPAEVEKSLMDFAFMDIPRIGPEVPYLQKAGNYAKEGMLLHSPPETLASLRNSPLRRELYQRLLTLYRQYKPCQPHPANIPCQTYPSDCSEYKQGRVYQLYFIHGFAYSFSMRGYEPLFPEDGFGESLMEQVPKKEWFNYLQKDGKSVRLTLADLFGKGDLLQKEVVAAIQKRDDLDLDCSSPGGFVEMIGENFSITEEAVLLYLSQSPYQEGDGVVLSIPWAELKEKAGAGWVANQF